MRILCANATSTHTPYTHSFWSLHSFLLDASTMVIWKGLFFSSSSSFSITFRLPRSGRTRSRRSIIIIFHMPTNKLKSTWYPFVAFLPPGAHKKYGQKYQRLYGFTTVECARIDCSCFGCAGMVGNWIAGATGN